VWGQVTKTLLLLLTSKSKNRKILVDNTNYCYYILSSFLKKFIETGIVKMIENQNLPLGMIVGRMNREMFRVLRKRTNESHEIKLTIEQFGLLHKISTNKEDVVQQDMAIILGKDKSSILRLIDSLEEQKLVKRVVDPHDRRRNCLIVTDLGHEVIKHYLRIEFELLKELQKGLTESDLETFYKVVYTIQKNAEKL
jgi:MarR family transcriptional regulator, transcriptional regulator for hemolysin